MNRDYVYMYLDNGFPIISDFPNYNQSNNEIKNLIKLRDKVLETNVKNDKLTIAKNIVISRINDCILVLDKQQ
jgi:hypothetical protein